MSTRTVKLPLVNTDAGSRLIGYLASQQRLAYNHAVHVLNREPSIPKRATTGSSYGLNKRTTAWRNQDPKARHAPYHIHQQGSEAAHLANQGIIESRIKRVARIEAAHARGNQPHPSDTRPHRRTLARRSRKHGTQTLTIRARQFITPIVRYTFTVTGVDHVFRVRRPFPDNILAMQFVEIPDRRRSVNAPLHAIPYELHVAVNEAGPEPSELDNVPLEHYDGMDDGVKNHWTFSNGAQFSFVEHMPNRRPAAEKSVNQRKQKGSKRKRRHAQATNTRSRKRNADKKRQFNQHAVKHLENVRPAAMCIEDKSLANMTRSAAGKGRRRKAGLNRSLAAVGLSENQQILVNQCLKRGIHVIPVPAPGTSQTCPRCGHRHRENRETQASFRCQHCGWAGHADHSAAQVIRNRGFVRITEFIHGSTPCVQDAPTGWQEQPSRYGQLALLPVAQNTLKPKSSATKPCRSSRKPPGSAAPGRTSQVLGTNKSSAGAMRPPDSSDQSLETGLAQGVQTRLP